MAGLAKAGKWHTASQWAILGWAGPGWEGAGVRMSVWGRACHPLVVGGVGVGNWWCAGGAIAPPPRPSQAGAQGKTQGQAEMNGEARQPM